jgi:glycolate oxidase subunit GlcD
MTTDANPLTARPAMFRELERLLPDGHVIADGHALRTASTDATIGRGVSGHADALVMPTTAEQVASVVGWCYEHDVPLVPRGGGTGLAGGAVPSGGVVLSLERMATVRSIDPEQWRMHVDAGVTTAHVQRVARENGLWFPPDPGAAEQSMIGGNIATNAGGPHAFKYGVTGAWVTGLEVVVAPGEIIHVGGPIRKDVAGYDLVGLMTGSEGTLGVITSAWLRLIPAPEERAALVAFYGSNRAGCQAIAHVMGMGLQPTALEFLEGAALEACRGSFPFSVPDGACFGVLAEVDGDADEVSRLSHELRDVLSDGASGQVLALSEHRDVQAVWTWRDGLSLAVTAQKGGKISEDVVVPVERIEEAIEGTLAIGRAHGLGACSWGHAGDGNLHTTFMVDLNEQDQITRANAAAEEVFSMAIALGGSISGEHGIGILKAHKIAAALDPGVLRLQADIKRIFDPKSLLNPGKKVALG